MFAISSLEQMLNYYIKNKILVCYIQLDKMKQIKLNNKLKLIASESVGIGHPDKICDQIADHVLENILKQDPNSHVACEVFACNHLIIIGGEITTKGYIDITQCVWDILLPLGYNENDFTILSNINKQSEEIAAHVNKKNNKLGAGDIGVVYGYATNETPDYLPLPYVIASKIIYEINKQTFAKKLPGANFDSKCQVVSFYDHNDHPIGIDKIIISLQHKNDADLKKLFHKIRTQIIDKIVKSYNMNTDYELVFNNGGSFVIGGPFGDTGLTGRKIMVDTYGTIGRHGGGAFSGKDYTKVDRTYAYFARYIAKNLVAAKYADKMEIQFSFNIGSELPISLAVNCFGTNKISLDKIYEIIRNKFDLSLTNIVKKFQMTKLEYSKFSVYGHFTEFYNKKPWEKLDAFN